MDRQQEFVLRTIEERDIRFVRLWFTDVLGTLKSVAIAPAELEGAFAEGIGFDGSVIEGFARVYEADMLAKPDPAPSRCCRGAARAPARPGCSATSPCPTAPRAWPTRATCCSGRWPRPPTWGSPSTPTPRSSSSCSSRAGRPGQRPEPIDQAGYFDHVPHGNSHDFRRAAIAMLETMGISVEFSHHEGAPGQNEIDLRYADALSTADNIMTFRAVIKEVALEQGIFASFMPKPFAEYPGSGMHTHLSLFEGDTNAFHEPGRALPAVARPAGSSSPACCTTAPRSAPSPTSGSTPTSGSGAAARRRPTSPGATTTARRMVRVPMYKPTQGQQQPRRGAQPRLRVQPLPRLRGAAGRGPARASRRATTCRPRPRTTCGASPTPSAGRWASSRCRPASARRSR